MLFVAGVSLLLTSLASVTYENPGARAEVVLAELSQVTGAQLRAEKSTRDEVLCLHLAGTPLQEALDRIAWSIGGSWRTEPDGTRTLTRTFADQKQEAEEERQNLISAYRDAEISLGSHPIGVTKVSRRILQAIPREELALVPAGTSVVYSTTPNRLQRKLPINLELAIGELLAADRAADDEHGSTALTWLDSPGDCTRLLCRVDMAVGSSECQLRWSVYNDRRQEVVTGTSSVTPKADLQWLPKVTFAQEQPWHGCIDQQVPPEMLDPLQNEPLARLAGDALLLVCRAARRSMVACLDDDSDVILEGGYLYSLRAFVASHQVKVGTDRLDFRPRSGTRSRRLRSDRRALTRFLRSVRHTTKLSTDDLLSWPELPFRESALLDSILASLPVDQPDAIYLPFLRRLTDSQRARAAVSGLPLSDLTPEQLDALLQIELNRELIDNDRPDLSQLATTFVTTNCRDFISLGELALEPSEVIGGSRRGVFHIFRWRELAVWPQLDIEEFPCGAMDFAKLLNIGERLRSTPIADRFKVNALAMGSLQWTIWLAQYDGAFASDRDYTATKSKSPTISYRDLPVDFREAVQRCRKLPTTPKM